MACTKLPLNRLGGQRGGASPRSLRLRSARDDAGAEDDIVPPVWPLSVPRSTLGPPPFYRVAPPPGRDGPSSGSSQRTAVDPRRRIHARLGALRRRHVARVRGRRDAPPAEGRRQSPLA